MPGLDEYSGSAIKVYAKTSTNDFSVRSNTIILIEDDDITVAVSAVRV